MEDSILKSTKKFVGVEADVVVFDEEIALQINAAFSVLKQLGIVPEDFLVDDEEKKWSDLTIPPLQLSWVKNYIQLKTRLGFDPPATSFHIEVYNRQIEQIEYRLNVAREDILAQAEESV